MTRYFVTGNENKAEEARRVLGSVSRVSIDLAERQGRLEEIVEMKAEDAYDVVGEPCFVDDTGLYLEELGGFPGPYIKGFMQCLSAEEIAEKFRGTRVSTACCIGYCDGGSVSVFTEEVTGTVVLPRGENGFGFDPIFEPDGFDKTWAEMSSGEKAEVSHRREALEALKSFLGS